MKPISNHVIHEYMSVLVGIYRGGVERIQADSPAMASLARRADFNAVLDHLCSADYIHLFEASDMAPVITLTDKGKTYLENRRDKLYRFWMNSIIVPILVSIITAFITVYILPFLGERARSWLRMPPQRIEQSEPAASQAGDPSGNP